MGQRLIAPGWIRIVESYQQHGRRILGSSMQQRWGFILRQVIEPGLKVDFWVLSIRKTNYGALTLQVDSSLEGA
jgi:hypothetical protein